MQTSAITGMNTELALFELTSSDGSFVVTTSLNNRTLDFSLYSEFKYGKRSAAELFGDLIAEQLIVRFRDQVHPGEEIVVLGTPYKNLPNGARLLAITAERHLRMSGYCSSYGRIYQDHVGDGVYSTFTQAERDVRNNLKNRFFDPTKLEGRHIVVIDDVRITGSIQRSIAKLLDPIPKLSLTIVNLAQLEPELAQREPHLESDLNHFAVKDINDILRLMQAEHDFVLMTRVVRFILQSTPHDVQWLLDRLSVNQVVTLYEAVIEERYDQIENYRATAQLVTARRNSL